MQLTALYAIISLNPRNSLKSYRLVSIQTAVAILCSSLLLNNTHAERTILLASATAAMFLPRRLLTFEVDPMGGAVLVAI